MRKRLLTLIGCALVMGTTLSGCGKTAGTAAGNEGGTEEAPKEAGENGAGVSDENGMKGADSVQDSGKGAEKEEGTKEGDSENASQDAGGSVSNTPGNAPEASDKEASGTGNGGKIAPAGEAATDTTVTQKGPFGSISLTLPAGWKVELCPMDSDSLLMGDYGICFAPEDADFGFVEVAYWQSFGVCGTGLEEEEVTVAGHPAWKGTYDGHEYWDFICWKEPVKGVVAMTGSVEEWWEGKEEAVMEILDTLAFDPDMREGGAYVYETESENERIGLYLSLEGISPSGAMLCYNQYDKEAPTGQLQDGDDFSIEVKKDGKWEEAPIVVEGDYGFHDIAYTIFTDDTTRRELNWEWLYGELAPGEYRIRKKVMDFRGTGDYDQYEVYAYFILN